ncbi:DoxX family membrane protein [Mycolicibacterium flavescens]|uniref:DoxX family protein n=1 Tax=Mycolicibacterium flavescens TaxID=1776 RepID=A0A1E3RLV1_MYCFV|nr:DoxX family protein [Mycolicibacterium flavescens]MCV7281082.1 DoxX family membrane protein [Mycolicibacterium flavescens]ODQ90377.1 DoxX family protein [Mycolicibacterium flavescens]
MLIRRIARPMLSAAFIARGVEALRSPKPAADAARPTLEGLSKLPDPVGTNVPANAETVAKVTAAVQIGGGLLLASGKLPRLASAALAVSVVPGSLGGHTFWNETDPARKAEERRAFITDVSLIGGLIIAAVDTEGKPSLGWRGRQTAHKVSEAVTSALPAGAAAGGALGDSALADKVSHGLQVGAERGREIAHVALERGTELAEVARERGPEFAELARKRGAELADVARERGPEIADRARKRGTELADVARERGPELADVARKRSAVLADVARERGSEWADVARDRAPELAETARGRAQELAEKSRKQAKQARKEAKRQQRKLR